MGRYYYGDIHGKFWFAIQASNDASYFGAIPTPCYSFSCGCDVKQTKVETDTDLYCESCYLSVEEHRKSIRNESLWHLRELDYSFDDSDIPTLERKCMSLERRFGKYIESYELQDTEYNVTLKKNVPSEHLLPLARLCLGKQILHCLKENNSCYFSAEI